MSTESTSTPVVYVVAIDATPASDEVLDFACGLGSALSGPAELHIVNVLGPQPASAAAVASSDAAAIELSRALLDKGASRARSKFAGRVISHLTVGEPWREIVQLSSALAADLVVVGTSGRKGVARLALGSVAEKVVRHAGCPVLVSRRKDHHTETVPQIEPACPDCLQTQRQTNRQTLWCARHASKHPGAHLHYETPPTFGLGSMLIRS